MARQKNIADQIGDAVQDALEHQDFSKIQDMVAQGMDVAVKNIGAGISQAAQASRKMYEDYQRAQAERALHDQRQQEIARVSASRFGESRSLRGSGYALAAIGGTGTALFGAGALITLVGALVGPIAVFGPTAGLLLALTGGAAGVTAAGVKRLGLANRFARYRDAIGASESFPVADLARRAGRSAKQAADDLSKMIDKGLFLQAHLDEGSGTLYLTDDAFASHQADQERAAQERYREQLRQQAARDRGEARPITPEEQETLDEGRTLLQQIDARVPDLGSDEVTKKVQQIQTVARGIFDRAEQDPDVIEDLDQMVDYYLPLTIKLLDAYADLAAQPVQSESIGTSRQEIETTLDTLVRAFAKLHDSLFRDIAWDVSTDISVLNAVLAQDGLADDPFDKKSGGTHE